jgi:hypothetical protein
MSKQTKKKKKKTDDTQNRTYLVEKQQLVEWGESKKELLYVDTVQLERIR